jgi:uncharacterized membrane protein
MKDGKVFWVVVGLVSVVVFGGFLYLSLELETAKPMWGVLLMPILWASYKDHSGKKKKKNES